MQEELDELRPLKEAREANLRAGKDAESMVMKLQNSLADTNREIERLRLVNEDLLNKCRSLPDLEGKNNALMTENNKL